MAIGLKPPSPNTLAYLTCTLFIKPKYGSWIYFFTSIVVKSFINKWELTLNPKLYYEKDKQRGITLNPKLYYENDKQRGTTLNPKLYYENDKQRGTTLNPKLYMQGHNERGCKFITRKMSAKQQEIKE